MIILMSKVVSIYHQKTCMRLTNAEWNILEKICIKEKISRKNLLENIKQQHNSELNMTSAVRLFMQIYLFTYWQNINSYPLHKIDIFHKTLDELH